MNVSNLNAVVLPLMAIIFIADSIRDKKTGVYLGYFNLKTAFYSIGILIVEIYAMIDEHGMSLLSIGRAIAITLLPLIGAYVFVRFSHKENYGVEFGSSKHKDS